MPPHSVTMPAEWQAQSAVILAWPHAGTDWAPILDKVEPVFAHIAAEISHREPVLLIANSHAHQQHISQQLQRQQAKMAQIHFAQLPTNDTWARDFAPLTVMHNNLPQLLNFSFNAWGNKYNATLDNAINTGLAEQGFFKPALKSIDFILEGGSIESDGERTILTTEACLLSTQRNPGLGKQDIEEILADTLGAQQLLWLKHGHLAGDDTDSHIDNLARFVSPDCIAYVQCNDKNDPHYLDLSNMEVELQIFRTPAGKPYRLIPLPMPSAIYDTEGRRLPASYANFLIINQAVLVPTFAQSSDAVALETLKTCFPDRDIIGIDCRDIIEQNGGIHCLTMQLPAGVFRPA